MRIAITAHSFPPARLTGTENYAESYAAALARAGHQVHVFAAEKNIRNADLTVREESRSGFHISWITNNLFLTDFRETYVRPKVTERFRQFLDKARPDLLHCMHLMDLGVGLLTMAKERGIPIGYTLHDFWFTCPRWGQRHHPDGYICETVSHAICVKCLRSMPWRQPRGAAGAARGLRWLQDNFGIDLAEPVKRAARATQARLAKGASRGSSASLTVQELDERRRVLRAEAVASTDIFFAPSRFLRDQMVTFGIPKTKILTSMIGIDTLPLRHVERTKSPRVRVAFHGSFMRTKGPDLLLRAWSSLPAATAARGVLTLRGAARDAGFERELTTLAKRADATIEPEFGRDDLAAKLGSTDLLVMPSIWWENTPLVILEALAARVPLLVSNLGGMAELVEEGRGGYRFRAGDAGDLARALRECLESPAHLAKCVSREIPVRNIDEDARELPVKILEHHKS